jgi:DNA-binding MarR family transcriptional regulator
MHKTPKQLERYFKGVSNHRRIQILDLLYRSPGASLEEIARTLDANLKTISEHTRRLQLAGLINKKYVGNMVSHELSPYGKKMLRFLNSFE